MKRQSEELFFRYMTKPKQDESNEILIEVPDEIEFLPGDVIEVFVSETQNIGGLTYCARLICYKLNGENNIEVGLLSGLLADNVGAYNLPAVAASYLADMGGKRYIWIRSETGTSVLVEKASEILVNMTIHRSKKEIELYYIP